MLFASSSPGSTLKSDMTTAAPSLTKRSAQPAPIPSAARVMIATLLCSIPIINPLAPPPQFPSRRRSLCGYSSTRNIFPRLGANRNPPPLCTGPLLIHISPMGPLSGYKIVEMAGIGPAPMCAMLLADMGADLLVIDRTADSGLGIPVNAKYDLLRRGRRSVALDLKRAEAVQTVLRLVEQADAL